MKYLFIVLFFFSALCSFGKGIVRHLILPGVVLENETLAPLENADIEIWLDDSVILKYSSNEIGFFQIELHEADTYDIKVHLGGYHSQIHNGLIIESLRPYTTLDLFMIPLEQEDLDIHCGERCWCINHEKFNWEKDTFSIVQGFVYDERREEPLPFVNIAISINGEINHYVQSDFDGYFHFDSIPSDTFSLGFYTVGYRGMHYKKRHTKQSELWLLDIYLDEGGYRRHGCGYRTSYWDWEPPDIDLFAEEKEINDAIDAELPSTVYENSLDEPRMNAFPNPIINEVNITTLPKVDQIKIIDHMGIEMITLETGQRSSLSVDLSFLNRGLYFIEYEENGKNKLYGIVKE